MIKPSLTLALTLWFAAGCGPRPGSPPEGEAYPSRSISLICPWAAGGGTDRLSRFMAQELQERLGKPVVVINQVGGRGAAGHQKGARANADGHTVTMATFELSTMHWMGISQVTHTNFEPVMQLNADAAALLVQADAPWQDLAQFMDHVKANPGKLTMSGTQTGGAWDLARAGFLLAAGLPLDAIRWIPKNGAAPSLVELMGGHVDAVCCSVPEAAPQVESGQLRVLAVMAPDRLEKYPDIPTLREQGIPWEAVGWRGLMLPRETPPPIVAKLASTCRDIVDSSAFREFMDVNGFVPAIRGPEAFAAFLAEQDAQWEAVIKKAGYAP